MRERPDPGLVSSAGLALVVHLLLLAVLFFGMRWQIKRPEPVSAEIWTELPAVQPPPRVAPPPPPPPPDPPREAKPVEPPKPPPVALPKPLPAPDIALEKEKKQKEQKEQKEREEKAEKARQEKLAKEREQKLAKEREQRIAKEREDKLAEARRDADDELKREVSREETRQRELARQKAEREARDAAARQSAAQAESQGRAAWFDRIRAKVRSNVVLPDGLQGNPEATFNVVLLPTGEILSATLVRSSGNRQYDEALERALVKSSPLPLPERRELFERNLPPLRFRPKE